MNNKTDNKDEIKQEDQNIGKDNSEEANLENDAETSNKEEAPNYETLFNELNDKYLRLLAENQNIRKNHQQEK